LSQKLPSLFIERIKNQSEIQSGALVDALNSAPSVSVRFNPYKSFSHNLNDSVLWCDGAFYLSVRPTFVFDPLWHAGAYYVQEAGSMVLDFLLKNISLPQNPRVLDLCAAPGGKSTLLATAVYRKNGWLLANEIVRNRAQILAENLIKWGLPNTTVINSTPAEIGMKSEGMFDLIVVDAPCSGEGMFRKDLNARDEWSVDNVNLCAIRQVEILDEIASSIAPGGYLIYSTCTFNREENEAIAAQFSEKHDAEILRFDFPQFWGITASPCLSGEVYRFLPYKTRGEGFAITVFRMPDEGNRMHLKNRKNDFQPFKNKEVVSHWLNQSADFTFWQLKEKIYAFPVECTDEIIWAKSHFGLLHSGVQVGEIFGKNIKPLPELAFSVALSHEAFNKLEIDYDNSLTYLAKADIPVRDNSRGVGLVHFEGVALGFVNMLGNRYNNLYPKEWRIRIPRQENSIFTLAKG
jgi:16S rRNA C967 or C1407 C5-methylase (RsmB/RsmF family)/NOL1/NOP2/fmu family ribosome biogenesis protein